MNAINFIKDHGVDKAREVVEGAPHWPVIGWCAVGNNYIFEQCEHAPCSYSNLDNAWSEEYAIEFISLQNLKRLVESVDLVEHFGNDLVGAKQLLEFSNDCKNIELSGSVITVERLKQAIADVESCL